MPEPIVLWSTPRSASTAFDRMMRERGDHRVFTEPFSEAYYDGPETVSKRFVSADGPTYRAVWTEIRAAADAGAVFVKEMPHHLGPHLGRESLGGFRNTFLIRDPVWAVPSMLAMWPDATDEELGYAAQRQAFELVLAAAGRPPVIDATDLRREPEKVVSLWCEAVGLDHRPEALSWEPGLPDGWERWAAWFTSAAASTGFVPPDDGPPPDVSPEVAVRIARCREQYEVLHSHRLG